MTTRNRVVALEELRFPWARFRGPGPTLRAYRTSTGEVVLTGERPTDTVARRTPAPADWVRVLGLAEDLARAHNAATPTAFHFDAIQFSVHVRADGRSASTDGFVGVDDDAADVRWRVAGLRRAVEEIGGLPVMATWPTVLRWSIQRSGGAVPSAHWDGGEVEAMIVQRLSGPGRAPHPGLSIVRRRPSAAAWSRFWKCCEEIDVWSFPKGPGKGIIDGLPYSIELATMDRQVASQGNAARDPALAERVLEMAKAVTKLAGSA